MTSREKAWKCWLEILEKLKETQCYMEKGKFVPTKSEVI